MRSPIVTCNFFPCNFGSKIATVCRTNSAGRTTDRRNRFTIESQRLPRDMRDSGQFLLRQREEFLRCLGQAVVVIQQIKDIRHRFQRIIYLVGKRGCEASGDSQFFGLAQLFFRRPSFAFQSSYLARRPEHRRSDDHQHSHHQHRCPECRREGVALLGVHGQPPNQWHHGEAEEEDSSRDQPCGIVSQNHSHPSPGRDGKQNSGSHEQKCNGGCERHVVLDFQAIQRPYPIGMADCRQR